MELCLFVTAGFRNTNQIGNAYGMTFSLPIVITLQTN
jgi:hypothetical protein